MPRISTFYGLVIAMYWDDHAPPHFHASYAGETAQILIHDGAPLAGSLPTRAIRLVREWAAMHRGELLENWDRARTRLPLLPIEPLS